jgi:hypothetical protein
VPFGCSDIRPNISHTEASDIATDLLSIDHRTVPKPVIAHRTFHGKFAGAPVHDHKNEPALRHRSTPETKIFFQLTAPVRRCSRPSALDYCSLKSVASSSSASVINRATFYLLGFDDLVILVRHLLTTLI